MVKYRYACSLCGEVTELHRAPESRPDTPWCRCGGATARALMTPLAENTRQGSRCKRQLRLKIRRARAAETGTINGIVERAIDTWPISGRVKRLTRPLLRYNAADLEQFELLAAVEPSAGMLGIAAWSPEPTSLSTKACLHGLFVDARWHRHGVGHALLCAVVEQARHRRRELLVLRTTRTAENFFLRHGFQPNLREPIPLYPRQLQRAL